MASHSSALAWKSPWRRSLVGFSPWKSRAQLSDFPFTFHFQALEKEMATHSSVLAWRIPGKAEPGGLLSMGSYIVGHDWSDLVAAAIKLINVHYVELLKKKNSILAKLCWWHLMINAVLVICMGPTIFPVTRIKTNWPIATSLQCKRMEKWLYHFVL